MYGINVKSGAWRAEAARAAYPTNSTMSKSVNYYTQIIQGSLTDNPDDECREEPRLLPDHLPGMVDGCCEKE
jgi:hypothetical protein